MRSERSTSERRFPTGRRAVLRAIAGVTAGIHLASGQAVGDQHADAPAGSGGFVVEQGGQTHEVVPLSGSVPVDELYDLRIPDVYGGDNGSTDPGVGPYFMSAGTTDLQRESTTITFLYDGPNGMSLVVVHDAPGGDGGSASWTITGTLDDLDWLVKDDYYTDPGTGQPAPSNYDSWQVDGPTHEIDWTWSATAGDGGVLGYLGDPVDLSIEPRYGESAALHEQFYAGMVDGWEFLSGDLADPSRIPLSLDETVRILRGAAGPGEGVGGGTPTEEGDGQDEEEDEKDGTGKDETREDDEKDEKEGKEKDEQDAKDEEDREKDRHKEKNGKKDEDSKEDAPPNDAGPKEDRGEGKEDERDEHGFGPKDDEDGGGWRERDDEEDDRGGDGWRDDDSDDDREDDEDDRTDDDRGRGDDDGEDDDDGDEDDRDDSD